MFYSYFLQSSVLPCSDPARRSTNLPAPGSEGVSLACSSIGWSTQLETQLSKSPSVESKFGAFLRTMHKQTVQRRQHAKHQTSGEAGLKVALWTKTQIPSSPPFRQRLHHEHHPCVSPLPSSLGDGGIYRKTLRRTKRGQLTIVTYSRTPLLWRSTKRRASTTHMPRHRTTMAHPLRR